MLTAAAEGRHRPPPTTTASSSPVVVVGRRLHQQTSAGRAASDKGSKRRGADRTPAVGSIGVGRQHQQQHQQPTLLPALMPQAAAAQKRIQRSDEYGENDKDAPPDREEEFEPLDWNPFGEGSSGEGDDDPNNDGNLFFPESAAGDGGAAAEQGEAAADDAARHRWHEVRQSSSATIKSQSSMGDDDSVRNYGAAAAAAAAAAPAAAIATAEGAVPSNKRGKNSGRATRSFAGKLGSKLGSARKTLLADVVKSPFGQQQRRRLDDLDDDEDDDDGGSNYAPFPHNPGAIDRRSQLTAPTATATATATEVRPTGESTRNLPTAAVSRVSSSSASQQQQQPAIANGGATTATVVRVRGTPVRPPAPVVVAGKVVVKGIAVPSSRPPPANASSSAPPPPDATEELNHIEAQVGSYERLVGSNRLIPPPPSQLRPAVASLRACSPRMDRLVDRVVAGELEGRDLTRCLTLNDTLREILGKYDNGASGGGGGGLYGSVGGGGSKQESEERKKGEGAKAASRAVKAKVVPLEEDDAAKSSSRNKQPKQRGAKSRMELLQPAALEYVESSLREVRNGDGSGRMGRRLSNETTGTGETVPTSNTSRRRLSDETNETGETVPVSNRTRDSSGRRLSDETDMTGETVPISNRTRDSSGRRLSDETDMTVETVPTSNRAQDSSSSSRLGGASRNQRPKGAPSRMAKLQPAALEFLESSLTEVQGNSSSSSSASLFSSSSTVMSAEEPIHPAAKKTIPSPPAGTEAAVDARSAPATASMAAVADRPSGEGGARAVAPKPLGGPQEARAAAASSLPIPARRARNERNARAASTRASLAGVREQLRVEKELEEIEREGVASDSSASILPPASEEGRGQGPGSRGSGPSPIAWNGEDSISRLEEEVFRLEKELTELNLEEDDGDYDYEVGADEEVSVSQMSFVSDADSSTASISTDLGFATMERELLNNLTSGTESSDNRGQSVDWQGVEEEDTKVSRVKFSNEVTVFEIPARVKRQKERTLEEELRELNLLEEDYGPDGEDDEDVADQDVANEEDDGEEDEDVADDDVADEEVSAVSDADDSSVASISTDQGFAKMERELLNNLTSGTERRPDNEGQPVAYALQGAEAEKKTTRVKFSDEATVFEIPAREPKPKKPKSRRRRSVDE